VNTQLTSKSVKANADMLSHFDLDSIRRIHSSF
jgi:hypothetical protein